MSMPFKLLPEMTLRGSVRATNRVGRAVYVNPVNPVAEIGCAVHIRTDVIALHTVAGRPKLNINPVAAIARDEVARPRRCAADDVVVTTVEIDTRAVGYAAVPAAFTPIELPCTVFPVAVLPKISSPLVPLPETRLRAFALVPPTVLLPLPIKMPSKELPRAAVPAAFVPMKLP